MDANKLRAVLETIPHSTIEIEPDGNKYVVTVTSEVFVGMDAWSREQLVWKSLYAHLSDYEVSRVAFVFIRTPDEARERAGT